MRFFVLTIIIVALSLCGSTAKAQCFSGSCHLPGRPVARIANALTQLRAFPIASRQARPIRRLIAARRPVRRLFEARPLRRVTFRRWR